MSGGVSSGLRWGAWTALAVVLGIAVAMWFEKGEPLAERVLARAPDDSAIVAYAELKPLRGSRLLGRIVRERLQSRAELSFVEPDLEAVAIAVGTDEIAGMAAGRFPVSIVQSYLERNGATCPADLDEQACSMPGERGGYLSIRALGSGLFGMTNGPRPDAANRLATIGANGPRWASEARAALDDGALIWMSIDPRRLAQTMSNPPEGWINLSLVARALVTAETASMNLRDEESGRGVEARIEAVCGSDEDASELAKVLESLNKLAATALRSGSSEENHAWAQALDEEFTSTSNARNVTARWLLPEGLLGRWFQGGR